VVFSIDPVIARTVANTDSTVSLIFLQEGITKLYSQIVTTCDTIRDSLKITIKKHADSLSLGTDKTVCGNVDFIFNAGFGFKSYLWQDGSSNQTFLASATGTYHVTVTDFCGNVRRDSIVVSTNLPEPFDIGPDRYICPGDSTTLAAQTGFSNYQWSPTSNLISNNHTAIVFPATTTKYFATAERTPGCISTDSVWVYVFNKLSISLGDDTSFCIGAGKILDAGSGFTGYLWSTGAGTRQISATATGDYSVIATDSNGCQAKDTLSVLSVYPLPVVNLSNDSTICSGNTMILDAGPGSILYLWQDGSTGQTFNARDTGTYWVKVTSTSNCNASDTARIIIINAAPADFIIPNTSLCRGTTLTLQPTQPLTSYLWSTGATANNITISAAGTYWLEATNAAGCKTKEFSVVTFKDCVNRINFPNAFTPNNDGLNDLFRPIITGPIIQYSLVVYNRYGERIFFTTDYQRGWDGIFKGVKQNTGTFTWYSHWQFLNEKPVSHTGTVTVIR
jgi:gliding motility-associated-like protein